MNQAKAADALRAGAAYIRQHGHMRGTACFDGKVCALGGIAKGLGLSTAICYHPTIHDEAYDSAAQALHQYLRESGVETMGIDRWNDATPADEVVETMEKAAAWIEELV